ncbi:MAG TPA: amino acid ABC transporter substrate-binding protein [Burkholderiaceae bacterium]
MSIQSRRKFIRSVGVVAAVAGAPFVARSQASTPIRIGWAISKSGPFAGGAASAQLPNYQMWVADVNAAGGISVGGVKRPIEVVEYDDRSQPEEAVRAFERLIGQDKVDFLLPPWGTGMNLAVAPTFNKGGFPQVTPSCITDRMPELVKRWNNLFSLLGTAASYAEGVVEILAQQRDAGRIGNKVALIHVTDQFGLELANAARKALAAAKFELVVNSGYPLSTQDMSPIIADVQRANPDALLAFSYPPDTLGLTEAARVRGFNPKVFYAGVGTALPVYGAKFGASAEGVMGPGGWLPDSATSKAYAARYQAFAKQPTEQWVGILCYSGLQALHQAIEKVGSLDRPKVVAALASGTFDTAIGPLHFENNVLRNGWLVGQWQGGAFRAVSPAKQTGAMPVIAKPAWKA